MYKYTIGVRQKRLPVCCAVLLLAGACTSPLTATSSGGTTKNKDDLIKRPPAIECDSLNAMKLALENAGDSSEDNPIAIALSGYELTPSNMLSIMRACTKFVSLDLSGCTGTILGSAVSADAASSVLEHQAYIVALILPETIKTLAFSAIASVQNSNSFTGYVNLKTLYAPGVKNVAAYAFFGCANLKTVLLPAAEFIDRGAFTCCRNLNTVVFGVKPPRMHSNVFDLCAEETLEIAIVFPEGFESDYGIQVEEQEQARLGVRQIVTVTMPANEGYEWLTKIGANKNANYFWDGFEITRDKLTVTLGPSNKEYY
ncbi:MAG: leucine-rich repeat domain-containing protein [Spirochaetaceae bacterium]|nr:leucine-rich repeat domain-containing protein [Spirochaetaceae bacterium]